MSDIQTVFYAQNREVKPSKAFSLARQDGKNRNGDQVTITVVSMVVPKEASTGQYKSKKYPLSQFRHATLEGQFDSMKFFTRLHTDGISRETPDSFGKRYRDTVVCYGFNGKPHVISKTEDFVSALQECADRGVPNPVWFVVPKDDVQKPAKEYPEFVVTGHKKDSVRNPVEESKFPSEKFDKVMSSGQTFYVHKERGSAYKPEDDMSKPTLSSDLAMNIFGTNYPNNQALKRKREQDDDNSKGRRADKRVKSSTIDLTSGGDEEDPIHLSSDDEDIEERTAAAAIQAEETPLEEFDDDMEEVYGDCTEGVGDLAEIDGLDQEEKFLQAILMESMGTEQWDEVFWKTFCLPLVHRTNDVKSKYLNDTDKEARTINPAYMITVDGLGRKLYPHQLFGLCWMLRQESRVWRGGILADEMGLGKTTTALALMLVSHRLRVNYKEVEDGDKGHRSLDDLKTEYSKQPIEIDDDDDDDGDGMLLGDTAARREHRKKVKEMRDLTSHLKCPNMENPSPGNFACNCCSSIYSVHRINCDKIKNGVQVVVLPPPLIGNWKREQKEILKSFIVYDLSRGNGKIEPKTVKAACGGNFSNVIVIVPTSTLWSKHFVDVILTENLVSFQTQVKGYEAKETQCRRLKLPVGRIFLDESHLHRSSTNQILKSLQYFNCPKWFLSGTPFEAGIQDIQFWVRALETPEWYTDDEAKEFTEENFTTLSADCKRILDPNNRNNTGETFETYIKKFSKLLKSIQIRRTPRTTLWTEKLLDLPPCKMKLMYPKLKDGGDKEYVTDIFIKGFTDIVNSQNKNNKTASDAIHKSSMLYSLIYTSFPGLRHVVPLTKKKDLQADNINKISRQKDTENIYYKDLVGVSTGAKSNGGSYIIKDNESLKALDTIVRRHSKRKRGDGNFEKGLVICDHPISAWIVFLYIKYICNKKTVYIGSTTNPNDRYEITEHVLQTDHIKDCQWLVSSYDIMSYGLNCHRANVIVLFEPNFMKTKEAQAIGRINRMGEEYEQVCYRILVNNSVATQRIVTKQETRGKVKDYVLEVNKDIGEEDKKDLGKLHNKVKKVAEEGKTCKQIIDAAKQGKRRQVAEGATQQEIEEKAASERSSKQGFKPGRGDPISNELIVIPDDSSDDQEFLKELELPASKKPMVKEYDGTEVNEEEEEDDDDDDDELY